MNDQLQTFIDSLGLAYKAGFVPFSKSRNDKPVKTASDLSINWRITLMRDGKELATDYSQGIGHLPHGLGNYGNRLSVDQFNAIHHACNTGMAPSSGNISNTTASRWNPGQWRAKLEAPKLTDVLYSLVMDSDAIEAGDFEEWADTFGYDKDSRSAEKLYKACLELGLKLRQLVGNANLDKLRELFEGY
jgi:hypothetical protein